jgi:hypothetical protein
VVPGGVTPVALPAPAGLGAANIHGAAPVFGKPCTHDQPAPAAVLPVPVILAMGRHDASG